jgi:hypothetical protein
MKLTDAQMRVLADIGRGEVLTRHFDVYGPKPDGHWWQWSKGAPVARRTAEVLIERGAITLADETRPYSGHRIANAFITERGRAVLNIHKQPGTE